MIIPPGPLSSDTFKYWIVDHVEHRVGFIMQSGAQVWSEASEVPGRAYDSQIARSIFDWDRWWVVNVTKRDHGMISQVYSPTTADAIQGRAVVYLDQNHWRTLADCVKDESQIRRKGEIGPARRLIDLQRDGKIILPVSSGNLLETSQLHGDRRYEVGRTMADLAGGWQMRHPLKVRQAEVTATVAKVLGFDPPPERAAFTLEPMAFMRETTDDVTLMESDDPRMFQLALSSSAVMADVLLDPDRLPRDQAPRWVEVNQQFTDWLANRPDAVKTKQVMTTIPVCQDLSNEVDAALEWAAADRADLPALSLSDVRKLLLAARMLGYYTRIATLRFMNPRTRWRANDLIDMMFLCCAVGYADYVAAENHTGEQLRQAQVAKGQSRSVFSTLEDLVNVLDGDARVLP